MNASEIESYHNSAFDEKKRFLGFIHGLGEKGLKRLFKFPGEDFSLWWFSLTAEKPNFKSNAYEKLTHFLFFKNNEYFKKTIRNRICENPLPQFIKGFHASCRYFFKIIYIKTAMNDFRKRRKELFSNQYCIVSYFPLINKEAAKEDIFENVYFRSFHRVLEKRHKSEYSHILLQVPIDGHDLKDSVDLAHRFLRYQSLFFLEEFFKPLHLFAFIFYYIYFSALFVLNMHWIKKMVLYEYKGKKLNVWHIFKADFCRSFCGIGLAASIWNILFFKELTGYLKKDAKIFSVYEMQGWEKALYACAKKKGNCTIGVQHTIVPEMLLNYFNDPQEIGGGNFVEKCPLPDHLATVGSIPADLFVKYGWPKERVFVWGAQRFEFLKNMNNFVIPWEEKENYFVCAFSLDAADSKRILFLLEKAFRKNAGYKIILKGHPAMDLKTLIDKTGVRLNPSMFEYANEPLEKIIKHAKGIIVTESSACFFALACSIPVIVLRFPDKVDCHPLSYITNIPVYIYSAEHLRSVCGRIVGLSASPVSQGKYQEAMRRYFYFPKDENEYLDKILHLNGHDNISQGRPLSAMRERGYCAEMV